MGRPALRIVLLATALVPLFAVAAGGQDAQVTVEGEVQHPGTYQANPGARFAEVVLAAAPTAQAYPLGAAVLRPAALPEQRALKAGLAYELDALAADPESPAALLPRVRAMQEWLASLPVTGRVRAELEPRRLELDRASNQRLAAGDRFLYPPRPDQLRVVGAVQAPCALAHVPLRDAADYLRDCAIDPASADRDRLYVIQPDGAVQALGIAAWNRGAPQALAPGAVIYVPLDERALRKSAPGFNAGLARFLATQPLPVATP